MSCLRNSLFADIYADISTAKIGFGSLYESVPNIVNHLCCSCRHCYSQYLTAQVVDGDGREIRRTKSSFHHYLCFLKWVPAYRLLEQEERETHYLCPDSVYLSSPEVFSLLGTHVFYVDINPSEFTRAIGKNVSMMVFISAVHSCSYWSYCNCCRLFGDNCLSLFLPL